MAIDTSTDVDIEATLEAALKVLRDKKEAPKEPKRIEGKYPYSVFIATPTLTGVRPNYFQSALSTLNEFNRRRVDHGFCVLDGSSLITSARNSMLRSFIASGKTHCFMIDDDIGWTPDCMFRMMESGLDFVAGAVPMRMFNTEALEYAVAKGKTKELHRYATQFNISMRDIGSGYEVNLDESGKAEITFAGTAFLMVTRRAVLEMMEKCGAEKYIDGGKETHDLFDVAIKNSQYWGEDSAFCARWRAIGGKIYVFPDMTFSHMGPVCITGRFADALET